jgi:hypothetical protein
MRSGGRHSGPSTRIALISFHTEGFPDEVEEEIIRFLERCPGTFDLYGGIATSDAFIRYCFENPADADAFHGQFAAAAKKATITR